MSDYKFGFEKLDVYKLSKELVGLVYGYTKIFPDTERYGLVSQLNRAVISIVSNIAEGNSRTTPKDKSHFTQLAYSSLMEVLCQIDISRDLKFITPQDYEILREKIEHLAKMLNGLRKYQRKASR